jgi:hypothetical protein
MSNQVQDIAKDAGILRAYHKSGRLDLNRLDNFLERVQLLAASESRKRSKNDRFSRQLGKMIKSKMKVA